MGVKRNVDTAGRVVIPSDMKNRLGLKYGSEVDVELVENKIVISNSKGIRSVEEIERYLSELKKWKEEKPDDESLETAINTLTWVLNKEE